MVEKQSEKANESEQFRNRRTEIVDKAAGLFARNGYSATGIREIGDAVGLDRGALYYYIQSKESLLEEIHDRVLDPLLAETKSISDLNYSAVTRLRLISESLLKNIIEHQDHVWVFLHEYRAFTGDRRDRFRKKRNQFEGQIASLFEEGKAAGELEFSDVRFTVMAFLGMHNYTYKWADHDHSVNPRQLSKVYCDIFFSGVERQRYGTSQDTRISETALL